MNHDHPITDITYVSKINKIKVLNLIRNKQAVSRTEIAKEMGLSLPTVSRLVDSLIQNEKLVQELGKMTSSLGRPPTLVKFAGENNFVIGLSIGNTYISGILADLNAQIIATHRIHTSANHGFKKLVRRTAGLIDKLIELSDVNEKQVFGVGIAIGGLIDVRRNLLAYSAAFNWEDKNIAGELEALVNKPVYFDHTARVMALGELWYGIGYKIKNFIYVLLGYGIGAALIMDSLPYYGTQGMTGEFGHITLEKDSQIQCTCGNFGCLEALASGYGIATLAQANLNQNKQSILYKRFSNDIPNLTVKEIAEAADQGDEFSKRILLEAANYIGIGVASLINLHNPQAIILGGGLTRIGDYFFDEIKKTAQKRSLHRLSRNVLIQPASLGDKSKVMGAVALILNEVLNLNIVG